MFPAVLGIDLSCIAWKDVTMEGFLLFTVNEALIKQTADLMISSGLKDAGYTYLVIDGEDFNYL